MAFKGLFQHKLFCDSKLKSVAPDPQKQGFVCGTVDHLHVPMLGGRYLQLLLF